MINRATRLQQRIRFHSEPNFRQADITIPVTDFLEWVKRLLPLDKFNVFLDLFRFPLPTPSLVGDIYTELERVFYSKNFSYDYQFVSRDLSRDWDSYRQNSLHEPDIWKVQGWEQLKSNPNSVLVVDLPQDQLSFRPEPYFYWLGLENVIDYSLDLDGCTFIYIIFKQPNGQIVVIDQTSYRVYQPQSIPTSVNTLGTLNFTGNVINTQPPGAANPLVSLGTPLINVAHNLGYCPARFFWSKSCINSIPDIKANPIFRELSELDWYLFYSLSKRHLDLYASYPIYAAYELECSYENEETGEHCDGGFIRDEHNHYELNPDGSLRRCPVCGNKRFVGAGSFLEVPMPSAIDGIPDIKQPVSITQVDRDGLDYNTTEVERLADKIRTSIVGSSGNSKVSQKEAINEEQIASNYGNQTNVLVSLKSNFEAAQKFVDDTICRLRYGSDFISSSINWGTEFYVFTVAELYDKYNKAKTNGASNSELEALSQSILEVEYRDNPLQLRRMKLLRELEPYPNYTVDETLNFYKNSLLSKDELILKINFITFVERFERENLDILEFGSRLNESSKVKIIYNKLIDYAKEQQTTNIPSTAGAGATIPAIGVQ